MDYKFIEGQRVKIWDIEDQMTCYGSVVATAPESVTIQWDDLLSPTKHEQDEFHLIEIVNQPLK